MQVMFQLAYIHVCTLISVLVLLYVHMDKCVLWSVLQLHVCVLWLMFQLCYIHYVCAYVFWSVFWFYYIHICVVCFPIKVPAPLYVCVHVCSDQLQLYLTHTHTVRALWSVFQLHYEHMCPDQCFSSVTMYMWLHIYR